APAPQPRRSFSSAWRSSGPALRSATRFRDRPIRFLSASHVHPSVAATSHSGEQTPHHPTRSWPSISPFLAPAQPAAAAQVVDQDCDFREHLIHSDERTRTCSRKSASKSKGKV